MQYLGKEVKATELFKEQAQKYVDNALNHCKLNDIDIEFTLNDFIEEILVDYAAEKVNQQSWHNKKLDEGTYPPSFNFSLVARPYGCYTLVAISEHPMWVRNI